jgi:GNAT superfamily N-acetyltransferase
MKQSEEFTLRFAEEKDISLVYDLIRELAVYEKMEDRLIASREDLKEAIFDRKSAEVILAELNGAAVGYAMYFHNFSSFIGKTGLYLEDIFIRPTYRGRGFGKAVLTYLAELAVKRNCWGMEWTCLDWNEPSIKFYESIGAVQNEGWRIYRLKGEALLNLSQN